MKSGTATGLDGFPVECLKKRGRKVLEWLVRPLNVSFDTRVVPMGWRGACMVPLYEGNGDKCECSKALGPELNVQKGRSHVGIGRVEDAWNKCLPEGRYVKTI